MLVALGQIVLLEPWFGSLGRRLVKSPKLYVAEPALVCALAGIRQDDLPRSPLIGPLWETFVFAELRKQLTFAGARPRLWYYRDQSNHEVDFVLERGHDLTLYECKWTSTPTPEMADAMAKVQTIFEARKSYRVAAETLVTRAPETFVATDVTYKTPFAGLA